MNKATTNGQERNRAVVLAPTVLVGDATVAELRDRVQSTIRGENQLAGIRAEALAELQRRAGTELTEVELRERGKKSRRRARSEIETARELKKLPETSKGLRDGEIPYDNARILAKASQEGEIDEKELLDDARSQSPDKFAATVRKHEQQRSTDDGVSKLQHQRSRRFARIRTAIEDGMTVLYGRFDPITGARIETALSRKMNELWQEEDPNNRATPAQRMADALALLVTRPGGDKDGPSQDVKLLVIADYDVVARQLHNARLENGTPIPASELRRLACDAQILPAIFGGPSVPMDMGMYGPAESQLGVAHPTGGAYRPGPGMYRVRSHVEHNGRTHNRCRPRSRSGHCLGSRHCHHWRTSVHGVRDHPGRVCEAVGMGKPAHHHPAGVVDRKHR